MMGVGWVFKYRMRGKVFVKMSEEGRADTKCGRKGV